MASADSSGTAQISSGGIESGIGHQAPGPCALVVGGPCFRNGITTSPYSTFVLDTK